MDAQDEMADLLVSTSGPKRTFGGVFVNGLFKMIDLNGIDGERMADTWTCFGDSSVQLRTPGTPQPLQCSAVENKESCKCFQGIQEAVDDPETLPGHTLLVHGGTYNENVVVNKPLTIAGDQDKNQTIDGGSSGHVVTITAPGVTIKGFTIKSNGNHTGIRIESDSNVIYDNNIQDCREGIYLYSNTRGNVVTGNTITRSRMIGIILYLSTENWLYSNTVIGSPEFGEMGILINYSNTNKIYANIIQGNNNGIYLNGSSYNIIHHNNFIDNYASARILGTCTENQWDNGAGNYWSDHPCTDSNNDGICDAPYYIPYGGGANDPYPLAAQWFPVCGNVNGDLQGQVTIGDISYLIDYLLLDPKGTPEPVPPCVADVNGDGEVDQADIDRLVDHLFISGAPIVPNCCSKLVLPYLFLHPPL
jgi:parallel beta-helix repeat protein